MYSLRLPRFKELLAYFDEMDDQVKTFAAARTKKCNDCGYCTQTDKTRTRSKAYVPEEHNGRHNLCTLFPGFSYVWSAVDTVTASEMIALLSCIDRIFQRPPDITKTTRDACEN